MLRRFFDRLDCCLVTWLAFDRVVLKWFCWVVFGRLHELLVCRDSTIDVAVWFSCFGWFRWSKWSIALRDSMVGLIGDSRSDGSAWLVVDVGRLIS